MKPAAYGLVLFLSMTVLSGTGCGVRGVKTDVPSVRQKGPIEDIDPFAISDEFAMIKQPETKNPPDTQQEIPAEKDRASRKPAEQPESRSSTPPVINTPRTIDTPPAETMGFRINIGIFDKEGDAKEFAKKTESKIDEKVYIVYEAPFFKVRVGDFTSLKEAEEYVKYLKTIGFASSWWIRTTINTQ